MTQSATKILLRQIREHGLPQPEPEFKFHKNRQWRFDLAWVDICLAFEIEGGVFIRGRHLRPKGFTEDICKYNSAALAGWLVLRATSEQIKKGKAISWLVDAISLSAKEETNKGDN